MTYKLALIGTGVQGQRYMETISKIETAKLLTPCNTTGSFQGNKCFKNWKDLVDLKPDAVIIAADPAITCDVIKYCNFLNIPVLAEKPVGLYLSDIQKLEKCKIPIVVNYINLFNPLYLKLKQEVYKRKINRIISIGYNNGPFRNFSCLYDYMPHDLSMCFDLLPGKYEIISQKANKSNNGLLFKIHMKCNNTEIRILAGNGAQEKQRKLAVFCDDGEKFIFDDKLNDNYTAPLTNVVNHLIDVIANKSSVYPKFDTTVNIHEILYKLGKNYDK